MFEELIGKNVSVSTLFSSYGGEGGSVPASFCGIVLGVKDNFLKMKVSSYNITYVGPTKGVAGWGSSLITQKTEINNEMYFNINTISYIKVEN